MSQTAKTMIATALALATTAVLSARQQPPAQPPQAPARQAATPARPTDTPSDDHEFVAKMANGGMAEVELGRLAVKNASSPDVKAFGQRMIDDHSKAGDELKAIADRKNIAWPTKLDSKEQALHDRLAALNGDAFDRAYIKAMISDHKKDVSELKTESKSGKDADVKAWATQTLPVVEDHLSQAEKADRSIRTTESSGKRQR